jgi:hypothetical protein
MREDGFVCAPTEPTSALMTERVSLMSILSDQHSATPLRGLRRGDGAAHTPEERLMLRSVPQMPFLLEKFGLIRFPRSSTTLGIIPEPIG